MSANLILFRWAILENHFDRYTRKGVTKHYIIKDKVVLSWAKHREKSDDKN